MSVRPKFDAESRRFRRTLAKARARARRPPPSADGLPPDFDDPSNLISPAEVRRSLALGRERAEAKARPKGRN